MKSELTSKQTDMINQVAATMAIEDMHLTKENRQDLNDILTGETTLKKSIEKTKRRYSHGQ